MRSPVIAKSERADRYIHKDDWDAVAPANFVDWKRGSNSFEEIAAYEGWAANLTGSKELGSVRAARVSSGFFRVVGATAMMCRTLRDDEGARVG